MSIKNARFELTLMRLQLADQDQVELLGQSIAQAVRDLHRDRSEGNEVVVQVKTNPPAADLPKVSAADSSDPADRFEMLLQAYDDAVSSAEAHDRTAISDHAVAKFGQEVSNARSALKNFVLR